GTGRVVCHGMVGSWRGTSDGPLSPIRSAPLPRLAVAAVTVVAAEKHGHGTGPVVGQGVVLPLCGAGNSLRPCGSVPIPALAAQRASSATPKQDGHTAGCVVGHRVVKPG